MIKACQKKILYVVGGENSVFESAYFVLREDNDSHCLGGDDILKEAERIISERLPEAKKKQRKREKFKKAIGIISGIESVLRSSENFVLSLSQLSQYGSKVKKQ